MAISEKWTELGSLITAMMFVYAMFQQYFPRHLRIYIQIYFHKLVGYAYPYIEITFPEHRGKYMKSSQAYLAIKNYLSTKSSKNARRLIAEDVKDSQSLVLTMDDRQEVTDKFNGVKVWWNSRKHVPLTQSFSFYPSQGKRYYKLTFHRRDREVITKGYIKHVLRQGKVIEVESRQRKLYTNNPSKSWYRWRGTKWSHVSFDHPATFDTLAMATEKKEGIMKELIKFRKGKDYYAKIGKAWKRGYLLYGPPGTGKSTMIVAIANFLNYDVYDLELTSVKDNSELRNLLIETTNKSVIVIEDIDCSLDLTGQRKEKKKKSGGDDEKESDSVSKKKEDVEEEKSKVTLSGLLNSIDGIWSSCGGERIIIFTTNFVEKLDPALIRPGRMDKHIDMSYCCFEAFKILAKNYLDIEYHELFVRIEELLQETKMTPADVAENLMPKSEEQEVESCLENLIDALEVAKEEARKKAEEEAAIVA